ncbi:MAG TPA: PAS domain-containing protein [Gemmatimonadales bacterium]
MSISPRLRPLSSSLTPVLRYAVAVLSVGVGALLLFGVGKLAAGGYDGRPILLVAVAVSALYGGMGPGFLALGLATLVTRDPVLAAAGVLLVLLCTRFRRAGPGHPTSSPAQHAPHSAGDRSALPPVMADVKPVTARADSPRLREVTTEATWRFRHEQPLDITLPEDEQVEHLYLYSVLAECNDAFARMYGFRSAADVVGTRLVVFCPPSNPENLAYLRSFIRSGYRLEDAQSHEIDRYGKSKYFVNNLVGIFERGQLVGAWGTQRDVTEIRGSKTRQEYNSRLHSTKSSSQ